MSVFITFAAALLIFGAVIAIHEFGHFAMAKLCGVQVNEFSIGMGPALIKTYRKGTQYTLRLLPVGGFVALEGEESPESTQAEGGNEDPGHPAGGAGTADGQASERGRRLAADAGDGSRRGDELRAGLCGAAAPHLAAQ